MFTWTGILLLSLIIPLLCCCKLAKTFDKGWLFGLGMFLIEPVFTLILASNLSMYEKSYTEKKIIDSQKYFENIESVQDHYSMSERRWIMTL